MTPDPARLPADDADAGDSAGLLETLRILRRRWWIVLMCAGICVAAAFAYAEHLEKQYTATSKLQFASSSIPSQVAGVPQPQAVDPEGEKATYLQLVTTTPVAELVVKTLKLHESPAALLEEVTASNPNNDYIIDISATSGNPARAAAVANAFAEQYVVYSQKQNETQLVRGEELINNKLKVLPAADAADRANLHTLYQKLLLLQAVQTSNAHIVDLSAAPSTPSAPKIKTIVLIALLVGLLIGVAVAFLVNLLDRRVKSVDELEALYGMPALSAIPRLPRAIRSARQREVALEPFRILYNALPLISSVDQVKTVLVTSAVSGEGKTTVALGLARAAADAGRRVALVEADLRHPNLAERLDVPRQPGGLASALLDNRDPTELLTPAPGGPEGLQILTTGAISSHAIDLLNAEKLAAVFNALRSHADLVVIDSAPLLPVADTRTLLDRIAIDACLVVGRIPVTAKDQARRTREVIHQRRLPGVGLVVDDSTVSGDDYYYAPSDGSAQRDFAAQSSEALSRPAPSRRARSARSSKSPLA